MKTYFLFPVEYLPKRESSRRKAKNDLSKKIQMQERLLDDDEDDDDRLPGLDLSDSDEDASWTPFKGDKSGGQDSMPMSR